MSQSSQVYFDGFFKDLSELFRDTSINSTEQAVLTLGLIIWQTKLKSKGVNELETKPYWDREIIEVVRKSMDEHCREDLYDDDVSRYVFRTLEQIPSSILYSIVRLINELDLEKFPFNTSFEIITRYVIDLIRSNSKNSYFVSNPQFARLLKEFVDLQPIRKIYDPVAGIGSLAFSINVRFRSKIYLQEKNRDLVIIGKLLAAFFPKNSIKFSVENSLLKPSVGDKSVDIIIGELPFSKPLRSLKREVQYLYEFPNVSTTGLFIQLAEARLNSKGKAFYLIPDGFLSNTIKSSIEFKNNLLKKDIVECIVSFPNGFLQPFSGVKTSLLILNKRKPQSRIGKVLLINAEKDSTAITSNFVEIDIPLVIEAYEAKTQIESKKIALVGYEDFANNEFDLQIKRYIGIDSSLITLGKDQDLVTLSEFITPIKIKSNKQNNLPYIKIGDLINDKIDTTLSLENWEVIDERNKGKILNEDAILTARVGEKLKPTYFKYLEQSISLNSGVIPFKIDTTKIDKDYLIAELNEDYFKQQVSNIRSGTAQSYWTPSSFLKLKVRIPRDKGKATSLQRQKNIANQHKENRIKEKQQEIIELRKKLQLEDKSLEVISNFKHDFMGKLERVSSGFKVLKYFLEEKADNKSNIQLNESITEFEEEGQQKSISLKQWIDQLESNIISSVDILENEIEQIKEDRETYQFDTFNMLNLLVEIKKEHTTNSIFSIKIDKGLEVEKNDFLNVNLDKSKFKNAINNLILNAEKHGFPEKDKNTNLVVFEADLVIENENNYVIIRYKNNGKPFPKGFTFQDFIQRGKKAGVSGNTGIGGDRINRIIRRHDGIFREADKATSNASIFPINFEILIPQNLE